MVENTKREEKFPKYTANQLVRIPRCSRALKQVHFANDRVIVMDDTKYFILDIRYTQNALTKLTNFIHKHDAER